MDKIDAIAKRIVLETIAGIISSSVLDDKEKLLRITCLLDGYNIRK